MEELAEAKLGWKDVLGEHASNPSQPRASGEKIQALGKTFTVSSCEHRIKAQFEEKIQADALRTALAVEDMAGPEAGAKALGRYIADRAAGHYNWDGRFVRGALDDVPGVRYLLFLLLRRCHKNLTEAQADAVFKDNPTGCTVAIRWALGNLQTPAAPNGLGTTENATGSTTENSTEPTTMDR